MCCVYALVTSLPKREDPSAGHTVIFKEALKGGGSCALQTGQGTAPGAVYTITSSCEGLLRSPPQPTSC